jgi:hypothetical protein
LTFDASSRVPGALEFADPNQQNPASFFKKWGFGVYAIATSFSNRVLTRSDVTRYQLSVIGFSKISIKIISHQYKGYRLVKWAKANNH